MKKNSKNGRKARGAGDDLSTKPVPERILIADDHSVVRRGLRLILEEAFPTAQFGEAGNYAQTMDLLRSGPWSLLLLDLHLPDRSGMEVLKDMKQFGLRVPVLVLSVYPEDQYALRALRAGAAGYLCKELGPEMLVTAAQRVLAGREYIGPSLAEKLVADYRGSAPKSPVDELSDREMQVLQQIGIGKTMTEIGIHLGLSVKTVSTYRVRLLAKLGLKNNAAAMRFAIDQGLVS